MVRPVQIGACRLRFRLHGNDSLKGKRQVAQSLSARLRQRFNCSVAEVDAVDQHQTLVLGVAYVSNSPGHASEVIDTVVAYVRGQSFEAELVSVERDVLDGP